MAYNEQEIATRSKSIDTFIERFAERLGVSAKAATVYADPVERNGVTVIPVAKVRYGFGGGRGSRAQEEGTGGGGGVHVSPIGYIELRDGGSEFKPISDPTSRVPVIIAGGLMGWLILRALRRLFR
jgi:uncharacterized spore protein YtfJ